MKSYIKLAGFLLAFFAFSTSMHAQNNAKKVTPPSDAPSGYTYDFNKAQDLILERISNPQKSNADAQVFLDQKDFPVINSAKKADAAYKDELRKWMEKNPDLIINTLKSRKDIVTQY